MILKMVLCCDILNDLAELALTKYQLKRFKISDSLFLG